MKKIIAYQSDNGKIFNSEEECIEYEEMMEENICLDIYADVEITARLTIKCSDSLKRKEIPTDNKKLHKRILERIVEDKEDLIADNAYCWGYSIQYEPEVDMKIFSYDSKLIDGNGNVILTPNYKAD